MTKPALAETPIRSADDLTARSAALLDPPVFGACSLWLSWLGPDGHALPVVVPVDDVPRVPDRTLLSGGRRLDVGFDQRLGPRADDGSAGERLLSPQHDSPEQQVAVLDELLTSISVLETT